VTIHVLDHRSHGLNGLLQPIGRDTQLLTPIPKFVRLVDVDPNVIGLSCFRFIVRHIVFSSLLSVLF